MELDTGAGVLIISKTTWRSKFPKLNIEKSDLHLTTCTVAGQKVEVQYEDQKKF